MSLYSEIEWRRPVSGYKKNPTSLIPLSTEIPSTLSRPRSTILAATITRSKIFQPFPKYSGK